MDQELDGEKVECTTCQKRFKHLRSLRRHVRDSHTLHHCDYCSHKFPHFRDLQHHIIHNHKDQSHGCKHCDRHFRTQLDASAHEEQEHDDLIPVPRYINPEPQSDRLIFHQVRSGVGGVIIVYRVAVREHVFRDLPSYKLESKPIVQYLIQKLINVERAVKWHLRLTCLFTRSTDVEETCSIVFTSPIKIGLLRAGDDIIADLDIVFSYFQQQIEDFQERGSGWELGECGGVCDVYLARYRPIRASTFLVLPKWLRDRKSVLNIQNKTSQDCFVLSILAAIYPQRTNSCRASVYGLYRCMLDCSMLTFPVTLDQITLFEKSNQIRVDVFGLDGKEVVILRQSKLGVYAVGVCLLLIESATKQHYCLIKSLDLFMTTSHHACYVCRTCLLSFNTIHRRNTHELDCSTNHQVMELPTNSNKIIRFKNISKMHRVPLVFVADIETLIRPIQGPLPNPSKSFTVPTSQHEVLLVAARGVFQCCEIDTRQYINVPVEEGVDAVLGIINSMIQIGNKHQITMNCRKIVMSGEDWRRFHRATRCGLCLTVFASKKCRDHCHFCGRYRMALCRDCNFEYYSKRHIHVYMHNFAGFDSAFVVPALAKIAKANKYGLECIANGADKFITVCMKIPFKNVKGESRTWHLKFFDTLQFLDGKLETVVNALQMEGGGCFDATRSFFGENTDLFMKKQYFPYTYMDSESRLNDTALPPPEAFYNDLSDEPISHEGYRHAQLMWSSMGCATLREYYIHYLMCDVTLLIDVWMNFRSFSLQHYRLDAANYLTGSALTYDAMLLFTGVSLELITDIEMYDMVTRGIRGGLSIVSNRVEFANEECHDGYDSELPNNTLFFVDAVNLYGWSMQQPLATGGYEWLSEEELVSFDVFAIASDGPLGFLIECDLVYPERLHDIHNSNPLAPELIVVRDNQLSNEQLNQKKLLNNKSHSVPKLIPHLGNRQYYVIDYRNLQLYLQLGMELGKIHRIIRFNQSAWMAPYIQFNTKMRQTASSNFQKSLFKRMNNSCFGKQLEDPCKYRSTILCTDSKKVEKLVRKPTYAGCTVYGDFLVCVHMRLAKVKLTKMRIVGGQITELAKGRMQDYYYNCLHRMFGDNLSLCLHDTDSYLVSIKNEPNFYSKLITLKEWHDFSTYPKDHALYDETNKGIPGFMAPECNGKRITGVVAIRAKCYAIQFSCGSEKKTLKGVSRNVRDKTLRFQDYLTCLRNHVPYRKDVMKMLCKHGGGMFTLAMNKSSLVNYDDKRHIVSLTETYAHGHYKINNTD